MSGTCKAIVYENGSRVLIGTIDVARMLSVTDHPRLAGLASHVNKKLQRALDTIAPRASVWP
jgi:hypothetical protein